MHSTAWQAVCGFLTDAYESLEGEITLRQLFVYMCGHGNAPFSIYQEDGKWKRHRYQDLPGLCAGAAVKMDALLPAGEKVVALHLANCAQWPLLFWALLMSGRTPLLLNASMPLSAYEGILQAQEVQTVISLEDGKGVYHPHLLLNESAPGDMGAFEKRWADQVIFMTSGTTGTPRLLVYNGRCMAGQIQSSRYFYRENSEIAYPASCGPMRQAAILPFSHIFGFVICVIWYPFLGSAIVYPASLRPDELMKCCRENHITHLCAVPSYYDLLARGLCMGAQRLLGSRADEFIRYLKYGGLYSPELMNRYQDYSKKLCNRALGGRIRYLISGGGMLSKETAGFFNRLGLFFCNGYGMTELGVLAVELSDDGNKRMQCAIGAPAYGAEFQLDAEGQLMVDCRYAAIGTWDKGEIQPLPRPFPTRDAAMLLPDGRYMLKGRQDDVIVDRNGGRLHPAEVEDSLRGLPGVTGVCVLGHEDQLIALLECPPAADREALAQAFDEMNRMAPLSMYVHKAYLVDHLDRSAKGELQRKKIRDAYLEKLTGIQFLAIAQREAREDAGDDPILSAIVKKAAELLNQPEEKMLPHANFFTELGGDSLAYLCLMQWMEGRFHVKLDGKDYQRPDTLYQWAVVIKQKRG